MIMNRSINCNCSYFCRWLNKAGAIAAAGASSVQTRNSELEVACLRA